MLAALYSVCLRVLGGSNISLLSATNSFVKLENMDRRLMFASVAIDPFKIAFFGALTALSIGAGYLFFNSRPGIAIRSIGDNERALVNLGRDPRPYVFLALAMANGLAGVAGLLIAMNQGFADVGMGQGDLVLGLAALILGEQTVARWIGARNLVLALLGGAVAGSVIYELVILLALRAGIAPSDLKLLTAAIVTIAMIATRGANEFYEERSF